MSQDRREKHSTSQAPMELFDPGHVYMTKSVTKLVGRREVDLKVVMTSHITGDWGNLPFDVEVGNYTAVSGNKSISSIVQQGAHHLRVKTNEVRSTTLISLFGEQVECPT